MAIYLFSNCPQYTLQGIIWPTIANISFHFACMWVLPFWYDDCVKVYDRGQLIAYPAGGPSSPKYVWSLIYRWVERHMGFP